MKIQDMRIIVVGNPWKNWIFVKLVTDEGIEGIGEATGGLSTLPNEGMLRELKSQVIGKDPRRILGLQEDIRKALFLQRGGEAASGIEIACWDIVGKIYGVPLYQMLGGKCRDRIRVYANGWYQGPRDPVFFAERAKEIVNMGYTALKFDPFGTAYKYITREEERFAMQLIESIRLAVGEDVDIMIEAHDRFALSQAIRIGHMIEEYHPFWYETPVMSSDLKDVNEVARRVNVPVIAGERQSDPREIARFLADGAVDLINPEILEIGGISGLLDCFAIARGFGASVAPHNAQSPLCTAVNIHIGISQPNLLIQECFDDSSVSWTDDVISGYPKVVNGYIEPSDLPGIGVEINEKEAAKHPYGEKNFLRLFEDGWEQRKGSR